MSEERKDMDFLKDFSTENIGKIRLKTLNEGIMFSEFSKCRDQLADMMRQHVVDCAKIIEQMNDLIEHMKELEKSKVEEIYAMMQKDFQTDETDCLDDLDEMDGIDGD